MVAHHIHIERVIHPVKSLGDLGLDPDCAFQSLNLYMPEHIHNASAISPRLTASQIRQVVGSHHLGGTTNNLLLDHSACDLTAEEIKWYENHLSIIRSHRLQRELSKMVSRDSTRRLASNPHIAPDLAMDLARRRDLRVILAENRGCPPEVLDYLSRCYFPSENLTTTVALNNNTPLVALERIAKSWYHRPRAYVTHRTDLSYPTVKRLSRDRSELVRASLAAQTIHVDILADLASDPNRVVRKFVAYSPRTPLEILWSMRDDPDDWVRQEVDARLSVVDVIDLFNLED